mgnify:CR=1 FL=1
MPKRPTKEFWEKVHPEVEEYYKKKYPVTGAKRARAVTGAIWHKKMKPGTKRRFEKMRIAREGQSGLIGKRIRDRRMERLAGRQARRVKRGGLVGLGLRMGSGDSDAERMIRTKRKDI